MHLIFKRILAWIIDWFLILVYATILFGIMMVLAFYHVAPLEPLHPVNGQLVVFLTLTLPVVLYGILFEAGARHATIGKRILRIEVTGNSLTLRDIIFRNVLKFLPWEIAHAGVLWINYIHTPETPVWIWGLLIIPQVLVIAYILTVVATKGSRSLYDMLAGTRVRHVPQHLPIVIVCALVLQPIGERFIQ